MLLFSKKVRISKGESYFDGISFCQVLKGITIKLSPKENNKFNINNKINKEKIIIINNLNNKDLNTKKINL